MASSKRSCQHIENETEADGGEVGGGGVGAADENGMSNFIFSPPTLTFYFAPSPLYSNLGFG